MKSSKSTLIYASIFLSIVSCTSEVEHDKALNYYTTIEIQKKIVLAEFDYYMEKLSVTLRQLKQSESDAFIESQINILHTDLLTAVEESENAIKKIYQLKEIDRNLKLKKKMIKYLKKYKKLGSSISNQVIDQLSQGYIYASKNKRDYLSIIAQNVTKLEQKGEELDALANTFKKEYGITDEELEIYGL